MWKAELSWPSSDIAYFFTTLGLLVSSRHFTCVNRPSLSFYYTKLTSLFYEKNFLTSANLDAPLSPIRLLPRLRERRVLFILNP